MDFRLKKVYNFLTLAPHILGSRLTMMKVKSIMTSDNAIKFRDIYTLHAQLLNVIPGLPISAEDNMYVLFEDADKKEVLLAMEWIDSNSIVEVKGVNARIEISNLNTDDFNIIKQSLLELGHKNLVITTF